MSLAAPSRRASVKLCVPFHDVDSLGIVWHGHYYKYLEVARSALLRACRLDVADFISLGYGMVVAESRCRHVHPLRYNEEFVVEAWFRDTEHRILVAYELRSLPESRRVARAHTALVTLGPDGRLLLETPDVIRNRIFT